MGKRASLRVQAWNVDLRLSLIGLDRQNCLLKGPQASGSVYLRGPIRMGNRYKLPPEGCKADGSLTLRGPRYGQQIP